MQVELSRKIDYWIGIPVCFILSSFKKIIQLFCLNKKTNQPKKIMFMEFSEMGSAILAYPAIKKAKAIYPKAEIYFWIFKQNRAAVDLLQIIPKTNVKTIDNNNLCYFIKNIVYNLIWMHKEKIDTIIDMELFSRFSSILTYLSRAKIRVGFYKYSLEGLYRGDLHSHKVIYNPYLHISENFISLVDSLKEAHDYDVLLKEPVSFAQHIDILPKIKISEDEKLNILKKLKNCNPNINQKSKKVVIRYDFCDRVGVRMWPKNSYLELIKKIGQLPNVLTILIGKEKVPILIENNKCINFTGLTTIREMVALFSLSDLVVGHDGGALHLASLTNIDIIALYGPEAPSLYSPLTRNKTVIYKNYRCSPCVSAYNHRKSTCRDNQCIKSITVEEVYKKVVQSLE